MTYLPILEPWELELVENLKDSMKSVKITFECNGRTVEGRVLVASLLLNLNCGYDFDLYDFTSISEGKKVFSKLKTFTTRFFANLNDKSLFSSISFCLIFSFRLINPHK